MFITVTDLLKKDNKTAKQLSFFNNYKKYTYCPYNFIYKEDSNCFNNNNVNKWINCIITYINDKLKYNDKVYYKCQNGLTVDLIGERGDDYLLPSNNKYINKYLLMMLINMSMKYNMHLLDSFIYMYITEPKDIVITKDKPSLIGDEINNSIGILYKDIDRFRLKTHIDDNILVNMVEGILDMNRKDNDIIIKTLPYKHSKEDIVQYLYTEGDNDVLCRRFINNYIVVFNLYSIIGNYGLNIPNKRINKLNNSIVDNIFYCLNNDQLFIDLIYNIVNTSQIYFNSNIERLLQLLILDDDFRGYLSSAQHYALKNFKDNLKRCVLTDKNNKIEQLNNYKKNNNKTCNKHNKISTDCTYYIKRDEFNINNKRVYKIIQKIDLYKDKRVDIFIMEQISGNRNGSKYVLNKYDCKDIGIEYKPNLEVFSQHLDWITETNK